MVEFDFEVVVLDDSLAHEVEILEGLAQVNDHGDDDGTEQQPAHCGLVILLARAHDAHQDDHQELVALVEQLQQVLHVDLEWLHFENIHEIADARQEVGHDLDRQDIFTKYNSEGHNQPSGEENCPQINSLFVVFLEVVDHRTHLQIERLVLKPIVEVTLEHEHHKRHHGRLGEPEQGDVVARVIVLV